MIDRAWTMTLRAHEPLALRYRRVLEDGAVRPFGDEVYAFTVYTAAGGTVTGVGGAPMSAASVGGADADGAYVEMAHPAGSTGLLSGRVGLMWEMAELLPGGERDPRFTGRLIVTPAPATVSGSAVSTARADTTMIVERDGGKPVREVVLRGARGQSAAEQLYLQGLIAEPTSAALAAWLQLSAGTGARGSGVFTAGQTTITLPESVPSGKSWWVRLWVRGVEQVPDVDYVALGTTLTLSTGLAATIEAGDAYRFLHAKG